MICPNCGENNSANFRYCGMCGTSLEARKPAGAPRTVNADAPRAQQNEAASSGVTRSRTNSQSTASAVHDIPPSGGPSFLGLDQPFTNEPASVSNSGQNETFSGLDSFFAPEEPGVSVRGVIFLLMLLAALGAGGWWAYTHYNGAKLGAASQAVPSGQTPQANTPEATANNPAASANNSAPDTNNPAPSAKGPEGAATDSSSAQNAASQPASSENSAAQPANAQPTESANSAPPAAAEPTVKPKTDRNPPAASKPATRAERSHAARNQKLARAEAKPSPRATAAAAASGDKGDAEFKRGEAYLYGRGVRQNCDQAIRNLKEASAKQNPKARSAFGTMYATGHCVPRDLPLSYSWFAQALHADPNNQILEKDLTAVWNQMTPPERQMAARTKP